MSNLVIVAIPDENDRVWKVSSEEVPHLTLLFLGDSAQVANQDKIIEFVDHAATTTLQRFYLPVDRRGELGDDQELGPADVLFFRKVSYDFRALWEFRSNLLKDDNIRTAYDSTTQHEGPWVPHLTLGYQNRPAKPDPTDRDYGFYDVSFTKIAVWPGNYSGPEFVLKDWWDEFNALSTVPMDVAMADKGVEFLNHHGVKGMRWGVRKSDVGGAAKAVGKGAGAVAKVVGKGADNTLFELNASTASTHRSIVNHATDQLIAHDLPALKAKHPTGGKLRNRLKKPLSAEARAYRKDVKAAYIKRLEESANAHTNFSGSRRYTLKEFGQPNTKKYYWNVSTETNPNRAKHADTPDTTTFEIKMHPVFDEDGYITALEVVSDDMAQTADLGAAFLAHAGLAVGGDHDAASQFLLEHYGIKGMRWGVHRANPEPVAPTATSHVPARARAKTKIKTEGGENHPAHEDAIKVAKAQAKLKKSGSAALSNKELQDVATRLQLERNVHQLVGASKTTTRGRKFVKNLTGLGKEANDTINTGVQTHRLIKQLA